jgi:hypothetical protein
MFVKMKYGKRKCIPPAFKNHFPIFQVLKYKVKQSMTHPIGGSSAANVFVVVALNECVATIPKRCFGYFG